MAKPYMVLQARQLEKADEHSGFSHIPSSTISVSIASGENTGNQESIDQVRESSDCKVLHGNNVWRRSSCTTSFTATKHPHQSRVVVRNDDTGAQRAADKEESKAPVDSLEGLFDVNPRTLSLSCDHGDVLGTNDTERGSPERTKETLELAQRTGGEVFAEGARVFPVSEAVGVVFGIASDHCDKGECEQHEN